MLLILHRMPIPSGPLKPPSLAVELPVGPPGRRTIRNGPKAEGGGPLRRLDGLISALDAEIIIAAGANPFASAPIDHGFLQLHGSARPTWKGLRLTTLCATRPTRLRLWPGYTGPLVEPA